jgi:[protein-PII] uridylyltransferase
MMLDTQRSARAVELIDSPAIVADLKALAAAYPGRDRELRTAIAQRLKSALGEARARAPRRCAPPRVRSS